MLRLEALMDFVVVGIDCCIVGVGFALDIDIVDDVGDCIVHYCSLVELVEVDIDVEIEGQWGQVVWEDDHLPLGIHLCQLDIGQ